MAYSSIKRKLCKCGSPKCYPTLQYNGWNFKCCPQELKDKVGTKRDVAKRNKAARNRTASLLSKDSDADKSKLLVLADKLFGDFVKMRDSNEHGDIICVCCGLPFNLKDKDSAGSSVVQTLHFISRGVYSLRFSPVNAAAGCTYCNFQMHLNPYGKEYVSFRNKVVATVGEIKTSQMEEQRRIINKLSAEDLKEVIQKYSPKVEQAKLK